MDIKDRILGSFLGLVCGDALGGPIEFAFPSDIKKRFGVLRDMVGGGWLLLEPGEYTDDSQMAIATAESLVELGEWNPEDVAQRFVAWMNSGPKDIGGTIGRSLSLIKRGTPWDRAGLEVSRNANGQAAGNGSIMRCGPIALAYHRRTLDELIRVSRECSVITHADERCQWSCVMLNSSIALILDGETRKSALIEKSLACVDNRDVIKTIRRAQDPNLVPGNSGFVLDTLEVAYRALLYTDSLEEAIVYAVNVGGDTDTHGAVAGALAGAYYGAESLPERWLNVIKDREYLTELAEKIGRLE